jgi:hypothetical protein
MRKLDYHEKYRIYGIALWWSHSVYITLAIESFTLDSYQPVGVRRAWMLLFDMRP